MSAACWVPSMSSSSTANSSPPNRAAVSVGRSAASSRSPTSRSTCVSDGMAEAVVDRLEVVEVDEHDAHRRALLRAPRQCVRDAVGEEGAVREPGDRVVERLVGELALERLALADVARVQDDAADVLVVDQVGVPDLELELGAVAVHQRALERVAVVLEPRRLEDVARCGRGRRVRRASGTSCRGARRRRSRAAARPTG